MTSLSTPPIEHPGFLAAVEADPTDPTPKLILADWLEDRGEHELAAAWRWCGEHGKCPQWYSSFHEWSWFTDPEPPTRCRAYLPAGLYDCLAAVNPPGEEFQDINFPTLSAAVAALAPHLKGHR